MHARFLSTLCLLLTVPYPSLPPNHPSTICSVGCYAVDGAGLVVGDPTQPGKAIVLGDSTLALNSQCAPTPVKLKANKKHTSVHAGWTSCPGAASKVRLKALITQACKRMQGTLFVGHKKVAFSGSASACIDPSKGGSAAAILGSVGSDIAGQGLAVYSPYEPPAIVTDNHFSTSASASGTQVLLLVDGDHQVRGLTISVPRSGDLGPEVMAVSA